MWVEVAQNVAHHAHTLGIPAVRAVSTVIHGVDDAAVYRFQPIAHIGQGAAHDDAHGVVHVGLFHLFFQIHLHDAGGFRLGNHGGIRMKDVLDFGIVVVLVISHFPCLSIAW